MKIKTTEWILRLGVFLTFTGHGSYALMVRAEWLSYLTTVGFSLAQARILMPLIGALDILIAFTVLLRPVRVALLWAAIWAFSTALIRPLSGLSWLEFIERGANWGAPLALLWMRGLPKNLKDLIK